MLPKEKAMRLIAGSIDEITKLTIDRIEQIYKAAEDLKKEVWNEAIEAAAKTAKEYLNSKGYKGVKTYAAVMELKK